LIILFHDKHSFLLSLYDNNFISRIDVETIRFIYQ